jgi:hypothetical protein
VVILPAGLDDTGKDGVPVPGQDGDQVNDLAGDAQLLLGQGRHLSQHVHLQCRPASTKKKEKCPGKMDQILFEDPVRLRTVKQPSDRKNIQLLCLNNSVTKCQILVYKKVDSLAFSKNTELYVYTEKYIQDGGHTSKLIIIMVNKTV